MVPGCRGEGREEEGVSVVSTDVGESNRRDQHDSVQVDLMPFLQDAGELGGARCAVAFANQILWRVPAAVAGDVLVDEVRKVVGILNDAVELGGGLTGTGRL